MLIAFETPPPRRDQKISAGWWFERSGDDRLSRRSAIMGLAGLTAVFGMGTGGTPPVSSPEFGRAGGQARSVAVEQAPVREVRSFDEACSLASAGRRQLIHPVTRTPMRSRVFSDDAILGYFTRIVADIGWDGGVGSGWSSRLAVRTGRLRRSLAVHSRPIDLVVFQEPSDHLVMETSS